MQKILFLDRDGLIIKEPPVDYQVDSLEKLEFVPGAIVNLHRIVRETDFLLVMVTNQDGLGTDRFPEDSFWSAHNKMLTILRGEGVRFEEILIDRSFPRDNAPTRKPRTGLLKHYFSNRFNLRDSWVVGDRLTDVKLAENIGCGAIWFASPDKRSQLTEERLDRITPLVTDSWEKIYHFLTRTERVARVMRNTRETEIELKLNLEGSGDYRIDTGIHFFNHMIAQLAVHSGSDLELRVKGDLAVDEHHTIEDTAIALGEAIKEALGSKKGINRFGFMLPMDESLARVALDFSNRSCLVWKVDFKREMLGDCPTEMFEHFFRSFCDAAGCTLHISARGSNDHHKIEAVFKAVARSIREAVKKEGITSVIPTSKGRL